MNYGVVNSSSYVADAPLDVRANFIRKVYNLFFVSLIVTVIAGAVAALPQFAVVLLPMWPLLSLVAFITVLVLSYSRRKSGLNTFLLYFYAALQGVLLGPVLKYFVSPEVAVQAAVLTIGVFGGLSLYAMQSKKDFSYLGGFLLAGLIALLLVSLLFAFGVLTSLGLYTVFCVLGVLIFSGFVLYDTSQILHRLQPGEEVIGALDLYIDFVMMFRFILSLVGIGSSDD